MAKFFNVLTEDDIQLLQGLVDKARQTLGNTATRQLVDWVEHQAPEVYVALTTRGGIPEVLGNEPGAAECDVYRLERDSLLRPSLVPMAQQVVVYNVSTVAVEESTWAIVVRDKFGSWFVTSSSPPAVADPGVSPPEPTPEPAPTSCFLAALRDSDCVWVLGTISGIDQSALLHFDVGSSRWTSTESGDVVTYPTGSGATEFWYDAGRVHLSAGGMELLECGDGCFSGGPLTGHGTQTDPGTGSGTGSGPSAGVCAGEAFTLCVSCTQCPPVPVPCCPLSEFDAGTKLRIYNSEDTLMAADPAWYCNINGDYSLRYDTTWGWYFFLDKYGAGGQGTCWSYAFFLVCVSDELSLQGYCLNGRTLDEAMLAGPDLISRGTLPDTHGRFIVWECGPPFRAQGHGYTTSGVCYVGGFDWCIPSTDCGDDPGTGTGTGTDPGGIPYGIGVGTMSSAGLPSSIITLPGITVKAGEELVVNWGAIGTFAGNFHATFAGHNMALAATKLGTLGGITASANISCRVPSVDETGDITVQNDFAQTAVLALSAVIVRNLANNTIDKNATASGTASAPDSGATGATTQAAEYVQGMALLYSASVPFAGSWTNGFTSGGQDVYSPIGLGGSFLVEGYVVASSTGTFDAALTGTTPDVWLACCATFK